jgi:hypothetical protein
VSTRSSWSINAKVIVMDVGGRISRRIGQCGKHHDRSVSKNSQPSAVCGMILRLTRLRSQWHLALTRTSSASSPGTPYPVGLLIIPQQTRHDRELSMLGADALIYVFANSETKIVDRGKTSITCDLWSNYHICTAKYRIGVIISSKIFCIYFLRRL